MEKKDPYLLLIENALGRLTLKYKVEFRYEIQKTALGYTFTIFQESNPILHKEIPDTNDPDQLSHLHYQIIRDFIVGGIERIIMQKENEKRIFPKKHEDVNDNAIHTTKASW